MSTTPAAPAASARPASGRPDGGTSARPAPANPAPANPASTASVPPASARPAVTAPAWPVRGLLALSTAAFTAVATEQLPAGLLPQMSASLQVAAGRAGFLVTGYAAASVLAAIPVTAALRGLPRRPVLIGVLTGSRCATWSPPSPPATR